MKIGQSPVNNFTLQDPSSADYNLVDYNGQIIILSFIDFASGWNWLNNLVNIDSNISSAGISSNVQILAVIVNAPSSIAITTKLGTTGITPTYPVLNDDGSIASIYRSEFLAANDNDFSGNASTDMWSFIISKDYVVSDKWHSNTTANGDPISFNRISLPATPAFNSAPANWADTEDYVVERIKNLNNPPKILSVTPTHGTTLNSVSSMEIVVSKLLNETEANTAANYVLSGGGVDTLAVDTSIPGGFTEVQYFRGADRVENVISLPFTGSVTDVNPDDSVTLTIQPGLHDTEAQSFSTTLATDNTVTYTVISTPPYILNVVKNPHTQ